MTQHRYVNIKTIFDMPAVTKHLPDICGTSKQEFNWSYLCIYTGTYFLCNNKVSMIVILKT